MRITQFSKNKPKRNAWQHPNHLANEQSRDSVYLYKDSFKGVDYQKTKHKITKDSYSFNPKDNYNLRATIQKNNNTKPLQLSVSSQTSFKGFNMNGVRKGIFKIYKPQIKEYSGKLWEESLKRFQDVNKTNADKFKQYIEDFNHLAKTDEAFRLRNYISKENANRLNENLLFNQPGKNIIHKAGSVLIKYIRTPFEYPVKKLALSSYGERNMSKLHAYYSKQKLYETTERNYRQITDRLETATVWDSLYRKRFGLPKRNDGDGFKIPFDELDDKLQRAASKKVDPLRGQYDTKNLAFWNRLLPGTMTALYLGNDAYNTTMRVSGDKTISKSEKRIRIAQEIFRISLAAIATKAAFEVFGQRTSRSMPFALLVAGATVVTTEIIGRKLVYKPILPTSKERLETLEKKRNSKSGPFAALGRILTRTQKSPELAANGLYQNQLRFEGKQNLKPSNNSKNIAFTGAIPLKTAVNFSKNEVKFLRELIKSQNLGKFNYQTRTLEKALKQLAKYSNDVKNKDIDEIISSMTQVPIGSKETKLGVGLKTVFAPVFWVKTAASWVVKKATNVKKLSPADEIATLKSEMNTNMKRIFEDYLKREDIAKQKVESNLDPTKWELKHLKDFISRYDDKLDEGVDGVKNYLLTVKKLLSKVETKDGSKVSLEDIAKDITAKNTSKYSDDSLNKFYKDLNDLDKHGKVTDYNSSAFSVANMVMARFLSALFLVTDSYNLTVLHGDDKKSAGSNAGERGVQETSRILTSAYINNFTHSFFKAFHNSALWKALTISLTNNFLTETLARKVVGRPIAEKSRLELEEIEAKNMASKNPIRKKLAYLIGKRTSSNTAINKVEKSKQPINFSNSARSLTDLTNTTDFDSASNNYIREYLRKKNKA